MFFSLLLYVYCSEIGHKVVTLNLSECCFYSRCDNRSSKSFGLIFFGLKLILGFITPNKRVSRFLYVCDVILRVCYFMVIFNIQLTIILYINNAMFFFDGLITHKYQVTVFQ